MFEDDLKFFDVELVDGVEVKTVRTGDSKSRKRNPIKGKLLGSKCNYILTTIPALKFPRNTDEIRECVLAAMLCVVPLSITIKLHKVQLSAILVDCFFKGPSISLVVLLQLNKKVYILPHLLRDVYHLIYHTFPERHRHGAKKPPNHSQYEAVLINNNGQPFKMLREVAGSKSFTKVTSTPENLIAAKRFISSKFIEQHFKPQWHRPTLLALAPELRVTKAKFHHSMHIGMNHQCLCKHYTTTLRWNLELQEDTDSWRQIVIRAIKCTPHSCDMGQLRQYVTNLQNYYRLYYEQVK